MRYSKELPPFELKCVKEIQGILINYCDTISLDCQIGILQGIVIKICCMTSEPRERFRDVIDSMVDFEESPAIEELDTWYHEKY